MGNFSFTAQYNIGFSLIIGILSILPRWKTGLIVNNVLFQVFPDTAPKKGDDPAAEGQLTPDQIVFSQLFPGIHV